MINKEGDNITHVEPITMAYMGKWGRLKKIVDLHLLAEVMKPYQNISISDLVKQFHIYRHTLCVCMREAGISQWFHVLNNDQLDHIIWLMKQVKPQAWYRYVVGYLCSFRLWIQLQHILKSLHWIDPVGCVLQQQQITRQRKYYCMSNTGKVFV
jgi:hypothetical protein